MAKSKSNPNLRVFDLHLVIRNIGYSYLVLRLHVYVDPVYVVREQSQPRAEAHTGRDNNLPVCAA
eukprot:1101572-Rhodomonas_salina.1